MNSRIELGRIAGITIYLDAFFVLLVIIFTYPYFTAGDSQRFSAGLLIVAGIVLSILLHELGHAFVARALNTRVLEIELTGLGGLVRFASALPKSALARVAIFLAGPAVNVVLWQGGRWAAEAAFQANAGMLGLVCLQLSTINLFLAVFNMLPAFPLDGGQALDALLGRLIGAIWAQRVVAVLGLVVAVVVGLYAIQALPWGVFMLLVAFFLLQHNWVSLQQVGGLGGRR
jgi:Zn-dependent protease